MEYLDNIKSIVESLLFVANEPLTIARMCEIIGVEESDLRTALKELEAAYDGEDRGIKIKKAAEGYSLYTNPQNFFYVDRLVQTANSRRLTQAALEVLAIIAYKQPVTRIEINNIRGVNSDTVLNSLVQKGLIKKKVQEKAAGAPVVYETTNVFLEVLGINTLDALPSIEQFAPDKKSAEQIKTQLISSLAKASSEDTSNRLEV